MHDGPSNHLAKIGRKVDGKDSLRLINVLVTVEVWIPTSRS